MSGAAIEAYAFDVEREGVWDPVWVSVDVCDDVACVK